MLIILFLVSHFNFLFVPCGRLSWLPVSFLLHVKYPLLYRIVSTSPRYKYRIVCTVYLHEKFKRYSRGNAEPVNLKIKCLLINVLC